MGLELVLATANPHKASEILAILAPEVADGLVLVPRPASVPDVVEDGATLEDNARLKARALARATDRAAVADDTGLFVPALDGDPGVYSARYAGEQASFADNVAKLLRVLGEERDRAARFVTVALVDLGAAGELVATGEVTGTITTAPRGEGGFGYDSVFVPDEGDGRTYAQMPPEDKDRYSHRGRAFRSLASMLRAAGLIGTRS